MTKTFFTLLLFVLLSPIASAQLIESVRGNGKAPFSYEGETLNLRTLGEVLKADPEAYESYRKAKGAVVPASIISGVGGFLVGWQIGNALADNGRDFNIGPFLGGLGLVSIAVVLSSSSDRKISAAVNQFNAGRQPALDGAVGWQLSAGSTANGYGLSLRF